MTMYLEQLTSWNEFSVGTLCILQLLRAGMQGIILHGTEILLAACPNTPAPHCRKEDISALQGCFLFIVGMNTLPRTALHAYILFLMFFKRNFLGY